MGTFTKKKSDFESDIQQPSIDGNGNTDLLSDGQPLDAFDRGFLDYVSTTASNVLPSASKFAGGIWEMVSHPVQTAKNIGQLGSSVISLVRDGEQGNEQLARDVGQFFADRYGGFENVAQTLRDDPVGFLADASMILTGGAMISARVPTVMAGAVAKNINKVAVAIDPINAGVKVTAYTLKKGGDAIGNVIGSTTGIGSKALTTAYMTGYTGENALAFTSHMRGSTNAIEETLSTAQKLIAELKNTNKNVFIQGKNGMNLADTPIDPNIVNKILMDFKNNHTFNGALDLSSQAQAKLKRVEKLIADFNANKGLHNAKGLDWLKKQIDNEYPTGVGNVGDSGVVIADIRSSIKDAVVNAVPEYANVMKTYEDAITLSKQLEDGLGLKANASAQLTLNKLNQAIKNNAQSQFGNKYNQLTALDEGGKLESMLSGDALNTWTPRGLQGVTAGGGTALALTGNPIAGGGLLAISSPRLMGEASHLAGKFAGATSPFITPAIKSTVGLSLAGQYADPNPYNMGTFTKKRDKEDEGLIINVNPTLEEYEESR